MTLSLLFLATCFFAYSNGANDNFKGVASLYGSRTCSYRTAISWATVTTFAGSISSIFLAQTLLTKFSGKGIVPDHFVGSEYFLLAVALGAGLTVIIATLTGFPISTTHALTGAIAGCGLVAVGSEINLAALGKGFVLPLLLSPVLAIGIAVFFTSCFTRSESPLELLNNGVFVLERRNAWSRCRNRRQLLHCAVPRPLEQSRLRSMSRKIARNVTPARFWESVLNRSWTPLISLAPGR
jgi:phosphate/sulfate permease